MAGLSKKVRRRGAPLPEKIDNYTDFICYQLEVPNSREYRDAVHGQLWDLAKWLFWEKSMSNDDDRATRAAQYWKTILRERLTIKNDCQDCEGEETCVTYYPTSPIFQYEPHAPDDSDASPANYNGLVWQYGSEFDAPLWSDDYLPFDVLCEPTPEINLINWLSGNVLNFNVPKISFSVTGEGRMELHLLKLFQGGGAVVVIDGDIYNSQYHNLQYKNYSNTIGIVLSLIDALFTAKQSPVVVAEFDLNGAGQHDIDIYFIPYVETDFDVTNVLSLGWGGGIRKIEWCGENYRLDFRQSPDDKCLLEYRENPSEPWQTAFNFALCESIKAKPCLSYQDIKDGQQTTEQNVNDYDTDPATYADQLQKPDADTDTAICYAVTLLVNAIAETTAERYRGERDFAALGAVSTAILTAGIIAFAPITSPVALAVAIGGVVGFSDLLGESVSDGEAVEAMESQDARDCVTRLIYDALASTTPTHTALKTATASTTFTDPDTELLRQVVDEVVQDFNVFVNWLGYANYAVQPARAGLLGNDCLSKCSNWCVVIDFTVDDGAFVTETVNAGNTGNWSPSGWSDSGHRIGSRYYGGVRIERSFAQSTITSIDVAVQYTKGSSDNPVVPALGIRDQDGDLTIIEHQNATSGVQVVAWTGNKLMSKISLLLITSAQDTATYTGSGTITSVTICGTGANPF